MSETGRSWFWWRRWRMILLLAVAFVVGWSAYSWWSDFRDQSERRARELMAPPAGAKCTIVFKAADLALENNRLDATSINGWDNFVSGEFVRLNADWIVLQRTDEQIWVPRDRVLVMRVD